MTDDDLDRSYTAVCEALAGVGEANSPLLLSILCLAMMSRLDNAQAVLDLLAVARLGCADGNVPVVQKAAGRGAAYEYP